MTERTTSSRSDFGQHHGMIYVLFVPATYKCEEIAALVITAAVEIFGCLHSVFTNIGSRVAHRDLTITARSDILTHVTSSGLDVRRCLDRVGLVVDDFVAREKGERVVVLGEFVNGGEDALQVHVVIRWLGIVSVDRVEGVVHVENQVDTGIVELLHAIGVVLGVVYRVHTDGVDTKILELLDIPCARGLVCERIRIVRRATGLVVNASNVESLLASPERCLSLLVGVPKKLI